MPKKQDEHQPEVAHQTTQGDSTTTVDPQSVPGAPFPPWWPGPGAPFDPGRAGLSPAGAEASVGEVADMMAPVYRAAVMSVAAQSALSDAGVVFGERVQTLMLSKSPPLPSPIEDPSPGLKGAEKDIQQWLNGIESAMADNESYFGGLADDPSKEPPNVCLRACAQAAMFFAQRWFALNKEAAQPGANQQHIAQQRQQLLNSMKTNSQRAGMCLNEPRQKVVGKPQPYK